MVLNPLEASSYYQRRGRQGEKGKLRLRPRPPGQLGPGQGWGSHHRVGEDSDNTPPRLLCPPTASPRPGAVGARSHSLWELAVLHEAGAGPGHGHTGPLAHSEQPAEGEFEA